MTDPKSNEHRQQKESKGQLKFVIHAGILKLVKFRPTHPLWYQRQQIKLLFSDKWLSTLLNYDIKLKIQ